MSCLITNTDHWDSHFTQYPGALAPGEGLVFFRASAQNLNNQNGAYTGASAPKYR
jgi:hypothetical protein